MGRAFRFRQQDYNLFETGANCLGYGKEFGKRKTNLNSQKPLFKKPSIVPLVIQTFHAYAYVHAIGQTPEISARHRRDVLIVSS